MEQKTEASQAVDERELLDNDGENRAVRTFLIQYSCDRSTTVGAMLAHMSRSGWRGYAPDFALEVRPETHLTKAGAQIWIRHLISLEPAALKAQPAPTEAQGEPYAWSYECRQPFTDPVIWAEFIGRDKPTKNDPKWTRNTKPLYERPAPTEAAQGGPIHTINGTFDSPFAYIDYLHNELATLAAQGEDSARLEFGEITSVVHNDRGTQHTLMVYFKTKAGRDDFRDVFGAMALKDRARASAETGGVKP